MNSIDDNIKWMTEVEVITHTKSEKNVNIGTRTERALVFLDTWSVVNEDGSVKTGLLGYLVSD